MTITVRRFENGDSPSIERLNRRFEDAKSPHRLYPEDLTKNPTEDLDRRPINHSLYVAVEQEDGEVRGGSWLREQYFWVAGERHRVGWMKYPVSESLVDARFAGVPASMIMQSLRRQPNLMALGMGGHDAPFARLLKGVRWSSSTIPFFFRIVRPFKVLRRLEYGRRRLWLRAAMDLAAWSGAGWLGHRVFSATGYRVPRPPAVNATVERRFIPWADPIWLACRDAYPALAARDGRTLDYLYYTSALGLERIRVSRDGTDLGWVVVQVMTGHAAAGYFGDLSVGVVTDALARPEDALDVLGAGCRHLEGRGVDIVITNFSHTAWIHAARRLRFLQGPSTFAFYRSPRADKLLLAGEPLERRCHLTRSDGDGPKGL